MTKSHWSGYRRGWNRGFRAALVEALGGECARCGVTDKRVLTIDHVHGRGNAHRRRVGHGTSYYISIARELLSGKYRVLCANCNHLARGITG